MRRGQIREVRLIDILLCSRWFSPSTGGVEIISEILAEQFVRAGAAVTVVTNTDGPSLDRPYTVHRRLRPTKLFALAKRSDIILQNLISLRTLLPLLMSGKPVVVTHQCWLQRTRDEKGWENYAKRFALRACHNIAISRSIAAALPVKSTIIGNPYPAAEFQPILPSRREKDIVFMGRLVPEKGCDLLLRAIAALRAKALFPSVTVIGDGPEMPALQALARQLGLTDQVEFTGALTQGRGAIVASHRIMAIPSLWAEPFGVVALEGIAAGCALVASADGGLPEAAGKCAVYFPNGDLMALTLQLQDLLTQPELRARLVANGPEHISLFNPERVAKRYLDFFGLLTS